MSFRRLASPLSALLLVVALAGCDGDGDVADDPEGALRDAVAALAEWDGVTLTVSLDVDDTAAASMTGRGELDEDELRLLRDGSIRLTVVGDDDEATLQAEISVGGDDLLGVYFDSATSQLALRADLPALRGHLDDPQATGGLDELIASMTAFGLQDAADALESGDWVEVTGIDAMRSMAEGFSPQEEDEGDEQDAERFAQALSERTEQLLEQDATVEHLGSEDAGERLRVTTDGASLERYLDDVAQLAARTGVGDELAPQAPTGTDIPAEATVSVDVWISGGELSQVAVDLAALEDDLDGEALLVIAMEEHSGTLTAPDAAASVDLFGIMGAFMGGMMGDLNGSDDDFEFDLDEEFEFEEDFDFDLDDDFDLDLGDLLGDLDCLTEQELEEMRTFMPDFAEDAEDMIEQGTLELC